MKNVSDQTFTLKFLDGEDFKIGEGESKFTMIINKFPDKKKLFNNASVALGEAYVNGDIDFIGNTQDIIESMIKNKNSFFHENKLLTILKKFKSISKSNSKEDIAYHYDIGNDFYSLWLDKTMSYSCAYFKTETDSLEDAQLNKIDHILKKLNLKEGQKLLDIGCGWGNLVIEAAKKYHVNALGITLSEAQFKKAKKRIKEEGLENLIEIKLMDYRDLAKINLQFDRVVSVGMAEHVGKTNLPLFFNIVNKVLKDEGLFLLHNITTLVESTGDGWILKYIFPGGYIPTLKEELYAANNFDFHTIDVESLRLHYMKTLMNWRDKFENNVEAISKMFDEKFIRMWRLYLNSCAAAFHYGDIDLHQILFSKGLNNNLPWTRSYLYNTKN
tara:strand:- start:3823 stop:4980 length:1158 start_codon:yes stop_codon:yes gene_type:complete